MAEDMVSECLTSISRSVGNIIGFKLASSLISESLERTKSMYKEVREVNITDSSVTVIMDSKVPEKRLMEILQAFLSDINVQYSRVIGMVSKTLIRKSLESITKKYGSKHTGLKELLKKY
jgi:hypothetical protein